MTAKEQDRVLADRIADADRMVQTEFHYRLIHGWARVLRLAEMALHRYKGRDVIVAHIEKVCKEAELHYYISPILFGCKLYVSHRIIHEDNYRDVGVPCAVAREHPKPLNSDPPKNKCQGKQNCANAEDLRVFSIKHDVGATHITFCEACWNEARVNIADPPVYHRKSRNYPVSGYYRRPAPKWDYLSPISCFK